MMVNTAHLRSGQWTAEEETYAKEIIKAFHDGYLECDEGRPTSALVFNSYVCRHLSTVSLPTLGLSHS